MVKRINLDDKFNPLIIEASMLFYEFTGYRPKTQKLIALRVFKVNKTGEDQEDKVSAQIECYVRRLKYNYLTASPTKMQFCPSIYEDRIAKAMKISRKKAQKCFAARRELRQVYKTELGI